MTVIVVSDRRTLTYHREMDATGSASPGAVLYHFSEDRSIERFEPHIPSTSPAKAPAVWAIDGEHAPVFWFPRQCPRLAVWPGDESGRLSFAASLHTAADRVHAIELGWLDRMRTTELFRYTFDAAPFHRWPEARGYWTSSVAVDPIAIEPVGDLLDAHAVAGIELRFVPNLWSLIDLTVVTAPDAGWEFSIIHKHLALPRVGSHR